MNRWIAGESSEVASSALRASLNSLTAVRQRASASECLWLYTTPPITAPISAMAAITATTIGHFLRLCGCGTPGTPPAT